jgi:transposase InsO family protein
VEHCDKNKQNSCSVVAMQDLSDLQLIKSPECIDNTYCKKTNSNVCSVNVTPVKSSSNCNARETGCHTESIQADSVNERLNTIDLENLDLKELTRLQKEDSILCVVRGWLESGIKPDWNDVSDKCPDVKYLWYRWDSLFLENEVLYRKWEHDDSSLFDLQIVVPNSFKKYILYQLHDSVTAGHLGVKKTLQNIRKRFFWIGLRKDVETWCKKCTICASRKSPQMKNKAPMKQFNCGARWERISIDFVGPFALTKKGNKYLMVVVDQFTKWTECVPLPNIETITVANALIEKVLQTFGMPLSIHTDQGVQFESNLFKELCNLFGIQKTRTTPYRPQSNGGTERTNRTITSMLTSFVSQFRDDWDQYVPFCLMAYRSSVHSATGHTPYKMMFGDDMRLPIDLVFGHPSGSENRLNENGNEYINKLKERLYDVHNFARNKLKLSSDVMKKNYDLKVNLQSYKIGDKVWYFNQQRKVGLSGKLALQWIGPCLVIGKVNDVLYRIQVNKKPKVVHHDKLKMYFEGNY